MRRVRVVRLRVNAAEKRKMGGCYESIDVSMVVPGASLRKCFVRNRGVGRTARKIAGIAERAAAPVFRANSRGLVQTSDSNRV
jgi:hypothetical protein